jgi:hypothetical protein
MERVHSSCRIEKSLIEKIKIMAAKDQRSFNNMLEVVIRAGVTQISKQNNSGSLPGAEAN